METRNLKLYGFKPDLCDFRDQTYSVSWYDTFFLPASVDLRPSCPPVYDQGELGSCTANAIAGMDQFLRMKEKLAGADSFVPSRLFIYYNERAIEGTVDQDSGAALRDGIKVLASQGVCAETSWEYEIKKFTDKPKTECYTEALTHEAVTYKRLPQTATAMRKCLSEGYPFVCGVSVYESFESDEVANGATVPMPSKNESLLGGHAICIVGYSKLEDVFIFRNSWGTTWSEQGYGKIPTKYLTDPNLASDFWTLRLTK